MYELSHDYHSINHIFKSLGIATKEINKDNFMEVLLGLSFVEGLAIIDDILKDDNFWPSREDKQAEKRFEQIKTFETMKKMHGPIDTQISRISNPQIEDFVDDYNRPVIPSTRQWGNNLISALGKYYKVSFEHGALEINGYKNERRQLTNIYSLIDRSFDEYFYKHLVSEINNTYKSGFYVSVLILSRKLFENLILDFLINSFKSEKVLYLNDKGTAILGFNDLVDSFKKIRGKLNDDRRLIDLYLSYIQSIRKASNTTAHNKFNIPSIEDIQKLKIPDTLEVFINICESNGVSIK